MSFTASDALLGRTERWFVRVGAPTMIEGYGVVMHVLPRMLPVLSFVTVASLAWLVPLRTAGSARWVLLGVVLAVTVAVWLTLSVFVRRLPRFSRATTIAILVVRETRPASPPAGSGG